MNFFYLFFAFIAFLFISLHFVGNDEHKKGLEAVQRELKDDEALPKLLVFGIALIGVGLLIANTALVAWFIIRKRIKGKKNTKRFFFLLFAFLLYAAERYFFHAFVLFNLFAPAELMLVPIVGHSSNTFFFLFCLDNFLFGCFFATDFNCN